MVFLWIIAFIWTSITNSKRSTTSIPCINRHYLKQKAIKYTCSGPNAIAKQTKFREKISEESETTTCLTGSMKLCCKQTHFDSWAKQTRSTLFWHVQHHCMHVSLSLFFLIPLCPCCERVSESNRKITNKHLTFIGLPLCLCLCKILRTIKVALALLLIGFSTTKNHWILVRKFSHS